MTSRSLRWIALLWLGLGCATPLPTSERAASTAFTETRDTSLGRLLESTLAHHPGQSGFFLLNTGEEALEARMTMADLAERSLDMQYYIWEGDSSSRILGERILGAADRGVRVRILLDDFYLGGSRDFTVAAFDRHPNIEVRIFNPMAIRQRPLLRGLELAVRVARLKHRMHNKLFVADNQVGIMGGRNIGDDYFGVDPEQNYRDLDVMTAGPIVPRISASFDTYWNSEWVVPIRVVRGRLPSREEAEAIMHEAHTFAEKERDLPHRLPPEQKAIVDTMTSLVERFVWGIADLVYDTPDKVKGDISQNLSHSLLGIVEETREEVLLVSPYLMPVSKELEGFARLRENGASIRVLMNSLASTDALLAHAGYAPHRRKMLEMGIHLHELRTDAASRSLYFAAPDGPGDLSLHAKTAVFDRRVVYIGSYNLDRLGAQVITEIGLIIHSPELAEQLLKVIEVDLRPENSWCVILEENDSRRKAGLVWVGAGEGGEVRYEHDPEVGTARRIQNFLLSLLPIR
jgi:putative cardiolipin synthase